MSLTASDTYKFTKLTPFLFISVLTLEQVRFLYKKKDTHATEICGPKVSFWTQHLKTKTQKIKYRKIKCSFKNVYVILPYPPN